MKVTVDSKLCENFNRCRAVLPEVFDVAEDGTSYAINGGIIPEGYEDDAKQAIAMCPVHAVKLVED